MIGADTAKVVEEFGLSVETVAKSTDGMAEIFGFSAELGAELESTVKLVEESTFSVLAAGTSPSILETISSGL